MKLSVVFAILQMSLGIIMKGFNSVYFKKGLDFTCEFVPQIILLLALFGWMDILIIGKWLTPKDVESIHVAGSDEYNKLALSPPIITTMIDMFLNMGSNKDGQKLK